MRRRGDVAVARGAAHVGLDRIQASVSQGVDDSASAGHRGRGARPEPAEDVLAGQRRLDADPGAGEGPRRVQRLARGEEVADAGWREARGR